MSDRAHQLAERIRRALAEASDIPAREVDLRVYTGSVCWFATTFLPDGRAIDAKGVTRFGALEALGLKLEMHWSRQHTSANQALMILRGETTGT